MPNYLVCVRTYEDDLGESLGFELAPSLPKAWALVQAILEEYPPPLWDTPFPIPAEVLPWGEGTRVRLIPRGGGPPLQAEVLAKRGGVQTASEFATLSLEVYEVSLCEVADAERR